MHVMNTRMSDILPQASRMLRRNPIPLSPTLSVYLKRSSPRFSHVGGAGLGSSFVIVNK